MISSLLNQLEIFWHLYLTDLLGFLIVLELLELRHLIQPRRLVEFNMLFYFIISQTHVLWKFRLSIQPYLIFFSVIDGLESFFTTGLCNNICLLLKFFKALPMVLHLLYYTLMNFLMVLSVILTSILMILLPTVSVIRCLFCDNNQN